MLPNPLSSSLPSVARRCAVERRAAPPTFDVSPPQPTAVIRPHVLFAIIALPLVLGTCTTAPTVAGIAPFTTDGCSRFPDRSLLTGQDWCSCCVAHDLAYWRGGTAAERLRADEELRSCVAQKTGNTALAQLMFVGVRAGGGPELATSYRWGYGWPHIRGYTALSASELAAASQLQQEFLAEHSPLSCPSK